jgi:colicin import membrane protein
MMRNLCCVLVMASSAAIGQSVASDAPTSSEQERTRIRAEKSLIENAFMDEERDCYQKFAVNDCLGRARVTRRDGLADLRRQELSINAQEARRRGAEQISKTEEKVSASAMREAENRLLEAQASQQDRINAMAQREAARLKTAQEAPQHTKERQERIDARDKAQVERAAQARAQTENQRVFELKQQEAQKRRQESDKQRQARKREISSPAAAPSDTRLDNRLDNRLDKAPNKPESSPSGTPTQP